MGVECCKATAGSPLTDKNVQTQAGLVLGTPAYMSPEQAELNAAGVDTRTDVYAVTEPGLGDIALSRDGLSVAAANPRQVVLSQDWRLLLTYGGDARARVIDLPTGKVLHDLAHPSVVWSGKFSPDGSQLLTGCDGGHGPSLGRGERSRNSRNSIKRSADVVGGVQSRWTARRDEGNRP